MKFLALLMLAVALPAAFAATGDVDGDRNVTMADAALALRYSGGLAAPTFQQASAADVQADGRVTLADAVRIARIAARVEPLPPTSSLGLTGVLTVPPSDLMRNFALPGGYVVSGRALGRNGTVFNGSVIFRDADGTDWGPAHIGAQGLYSIPLPPGTYQPYILTRRTDYTGNGEETMSEAAVSAGSPVGISGNRTDLNLTRPDISGVTTVAFDFAGLSRPYGSQAEIFLTDTGANAATGGLNSLRADVVFTPTDRPVPPGTYWVDTKSYYTLGSGLQQEMRVAFAQELSVPATRSRTLIFPTVFELSGNFTGTNGPNALDFYAEQIPKPDTNKTTVYVPERFGGYQVEIPGGAFMASVYVATPYADTTAEFVLPFTMPTARTRKDISLPALPRFRAVWGTVVGPTGAPLPGIRVQMDSVARTVPSAGAYFFHADTITDTDGIYSLALPEGEYDVMVTPA